MALTIDWIVDIEGEPTSTIIPVFGAALVLTSIEQVIVDASWHISDQVERAMQGRDSGLNPQCIQAYLLDPLHRTLKLDLLRQGTAYCHRVWHELLNVPVGQVMSYSELAQKLASGPRAVARACRDNPYAGLIPCHRIVAKSGIGGFMGQREGEMVALKQRILAHERNIIQVK